MKNLFLIISLIIATTGTTQIKGDNTILVGGVTFEQLAKSLNGNITYIKQKL